MRRALTAALVLALACAVAAPAGSVGASPPVAQAAGKCKKKHRKGHRKHKRGKHRKRCRGQQAGQNSPGKDGPSSDGSATNSPPGRLGVTEREISATELQLQLSRPSVTAGPTIVEQNNAGQDPHNLIVEKGDGSLLYSFAELAPGGRQRQTLNLTHGTWTLYCSLLNHRDLGMQATLTAN
jgi:plastocyanin